MRIEEQEYTKNFDIRIWKRVLPFLKPFKKTVAVVLIFNLICSLVDIAMPLFQRYAINTFINQKTLDGIWQFGLVYLLVVGFQFLSVVLFTRGSASLEMYMGKTMKRACFVHLQELSFSYYNVTPVGYILSRVYERYGPDCRDGRVEPDGYDVGAGLCDGGISGDAGAELETGSDYHDDRACAGSSDLVFSE